MSTPNPSPPPPLMGFPREEILYYDLGDVYYYRCQLNGWWVYVDGTRHSKWFIHAMPPGRTSFSDVIRMVHAAKCPPHRRGAVGKNDPLALYSAILEVARNYPLAIRTSS